MTSPGAGGPRWVDCRTGTGPIDGAQCGLAIGSHGVAWLGGPGLALRGVAWPGLALHGLARRSLARRSLHWKALHRFTGVFSGRGKRGNCETVKGEHLDGFPFMNFCRNQDGVRIPAGTFAPVLKLWSCSALIGVDCAQDEAQFV